MVGESAGEFVTVVGKQVVFSSKDRGLCDARATQEKMSSISRGLDISDKEHQIKVGQVFIKEGEAERAGYIKF